MPHLDDGVLHAMVDGEIPSAELEALQAHLAGCEGCRTRLLAARDEAATVRGLIDLVEPPDAIASKPAGGGTARPRGRGASWQTLAWAASLMLAVGLGYGLGRKGSPTAELPAAPPAVLASGETAPAPAPKALPASPPRSAPAPAEAKQEVAPATAARANAVESGERVDAERRTAQAMDMPAAQRAAPAADLSAAAPAAPSAMSGLSARKATAAREEVAGERDRATPIGLPEAAAFLGGRLRLIEGMVPERLERAGDRIRVVYPGAVVLEQWPEGDSVATRVLAPGLRPDSVAKLRGRIR